jgi:ribosomal protein S18 acetylase RimI-like enzyme
MVGIKLLLDTHIFIALEDPKVVPQGVALLAQKAQRHGLRLYLDDACIADVSRDANLERREATLSKLAKFPVLEGIGHTIEPELIRRFGSIKKPNDRCDVLMLDTLDLNVVDFLVSEDIGIHKRAQRAGLRDRVFTVREALAWLQRTYEPREFRVPYVLSKKVYQLSQGDPIFDSLREGYPNFDRWFAKCKHEHRDCWTVEIDGQLAGVAIYKPETHSDAKTQHLGPRILKVCTFKMKPEYRGQKFGEQLLKTILWYAQGNGYDLVYLTAFPEQAFLIALLETFGFEITQTRPNGEQVIEKTLVPNHQPVALEGRTALQTDMAVYPRFYDGDEVTKYVIPIQPDFHRVLFPEIAEVGTLPLFPQEQFLFSSTAQQDRQPGNTIRKVYVCRSPTRTLAAGDILLFYLSKSQELVRSQSITTIGVVEHSHRASSTEHLVHLVGGRSVYSRDHLAAWEASEKRPVLVIDFLLSGHFRPPVPLDGLLASGAFTNRPPQSIRRLSEQAWHDIRSTTRVHYE